MTDLALFDFDGTLTTREMFPDFMHAAVPRLRLAIGKCVLAPEVLAYRRGWISGTYVRARIVSFGFRGVSESVIQPIGERFAREVIPAALRPEAMARLQWHRQRGDTIAVVSGSLDVYLAHWCSKHSLELLCSQLDTRDGRLTGRYRGAQCVGAEKARRVREHFDLTQFSRIHAYGDTYEDEAMLMLADERWYRGRRRV